MTDLPKENFQEPAAGFEEMDRILGAVLENGSADERLAGEARNE